MSRRPGEEALLPRGSQDTHAYHPMLAAIAYFQHPPSTKGKEVLASAARRRTSISHWDAAVHGWARITLCSLEWLSTYQEPPPRCGRQVTGIMALPRRRGT